MSVKAYVNVYKDRVSPMTHSERQARSVRQPGCEAVVEIIRHKDGTVTTRVEHL